MLPPGADRSGFRLRSAASPYELKADISPWVGFGRVSHWSVQVMVTGPALSRCVIACPSAWSIMTTGIVIGGSPVSDGVIAPGALLYSTTALAPACWARSAFWWKEQVPRAIRATLPATSPIAPQAVFSCPDWSRPANANGISPEDGSCAEPLPPR